jgi:hypothetical protein
VVSALGFGLAYYFDTENGEFRRKQLHQRAQRALRTLNGALAHDVEDAPPVFPPVLRTHGAEGRTRRPAERAAAAH